MWGIGSCYTFCIFSDVPETDFGSIIPRVPGSLDDEKYGAMEMQGLALPPRWLQGEPAPILRRLSKDHCNDPFRRLLGSSRLFLGVCIQSSSSLPAFRRLPRVAFICLNRNPAPFAESGCVALQRHRRRGRERIRGRIIRPTVPAIIRPAARIRIGVRAGLILRVFVPTSAIRNAGRRGKATH